MPLTAGQRLSHYEIIAPIGSGTMGEVYRARDNRLEREVALKVLPDEVAGDTQRLMRFEREAKTLAALSHPNVAHVYGIDRDESTSFIAMELVPGEDLATKLSRGALPVAEAIDICCQIAMGLEAAHEAGVVHRDLKPANVVIADDGNAKLLDFGIAKRAVVEHGVSETAATVSDTLEGSLLGTPTYMAPEQARGKPADKRVDIWAFGCVVYECLTGRRAFDGETPAEAIASVLEKDPDWTAVPRAVPPGVQTLVRRCLDRNPRARLRDIGEARILLEKGISSPVVPEQPEVRKRSLSPATIALALGVFGAGLLVGWLEFTSPSSTVATPDGAAGTGRQAGTQVRLTELVGMEDKPAVSPDGEKVAFVSRVDGKQQIFVRLLAKGSWQQLTQADADHSFPRWKNDTTLVYFVHPESAGERGVLWETDYLGTSSPRPLMELTIGDVDVNHAGKKIAIFEKDGEGSALAAVDLTRSNRKTVYQLPTLDYGTPRWSPDDRFVAFEAKIGLHLNEIQILDTAEAEPTAEVIVRVTGQTRGLAWLPDGSGLVYASSKGSTLPYPPLFGLRVVSMAGDRDYSLGWRGGGYASYVDPDVSRDGKLVASRVAMASDIFRFPVDGTPLENVENALRVTNQTGLVQVPTASPDGEEVAFLSDSGGRANVWIARTDGSELRQVTDEQNPRTLIGIPRWSPTEDWITYWRAPPDSISQQWLVRSNGADPHWIADVRGAACWSHDGEWLYYTAPSDDLRKPTVKKVPVGGGDPVPVLDNADAIQVSSDGKIAYITPSDDRQGEVWKVTPLGSGTPEPLRIDLQPRIPLWPHHYSISPDDRWLATPLKDHGTTNLWLISTEDGALKQVTDFQQRPTIIGRQVSWSRDNKYIFAAVMETDADIVLLDGMLP